MIYIYPWLNIAYEMIISVMNRNELLKALGKNIQKQRKSLGISQEAFAASINMDRSYYGHIEQGKINISIEKLYLLCKPLKTSLENITKGIV